MNLTPPRQGNEFSYVGNDVIKSTGNKQENRGVNSNEFVNGVEGSSSLSDGNNDEPEDKKANLRKLALES